MESGSERSGGGSHRSGREPSGDGNNDAAPDGGDATHSHDSRAEKDFENNSSQGTPRSVADCESASEHGSDNGGTPVITTGGGGSESDRRKTSGNRGDAHAPAGGARRNSSGREEDTDEPVVVAADTTTAERKPDGDHPAGSIATLGAAEDGASDKKRQDEGESKGNGPGDATSPEVAPASAPAADVNSNDSSGGVKGGGGEEHWDDDSSWDGGDGEDSTDVDTEKPWVTPSEEAAKDYRKVCICRPVWSIMGYVLRGTRHTCICIYVVWDVRHCKRNPGC